MSEDVGVEMFLKGEPLSEENAKRRRAKFAWFGTSDRRGVALIKELCAENDEGFSRAMWDPDRKLWGTLRLENVKNLIESGLWTPLGLPPSKNQAVAIRVKQIVDARTAYAKKKRDQEERKRLDEQEKRQSDAIDKEMHRRKKYDEMFNFSESDADEAMKKYGIRRKILDVTKHFGFLGPSTSEPMTRINRWFNYPKNLERGIQKIVDQDFQVAFERYTQKITQRDRRPAASSKRKQPKTQFQAPQSAHFQEVIDRLTATKNDPHFLALKKISESAKKLKTRTPVYSRSCPQCGIKPIEQFMDCGCLDESNKRWSTCGVCNAIYNNEKLPCLCHTRACK